MREKVSKIRLFFALRLSASSERKVLALMRKLKQRFVGKFYQREKLHLTLAFLGWVRVDRLEAAEQIFRKQSARLCSFPVKANLLQLCRRSRARNHLWIRFEAGDKLIDFQSKLLALLKNKKFLVEKRCFLPHLTLARQLITKKKIKESLQLDSEFKQFILYQSTLLPQGSRYRKLLSKSR